MGWVMELQGEPITRLYTQIFNRGRIEWKLRSKEYNRQIGQSTYIESSEIWFGLQLWLQRSKKQCWSIGLRKGTYLLVPYTDSGTLNQTWILKTDFSQKHRRSQFSQNRIGERLSFKLINSLLSTIHQQLLFQLFFSKFDYYRSEINYWLLFQFVYFAKGLLKKMSICSKDRLKFLKTSMKNL